MEANILSLPEWQDDSRMHVLFCSYDGHESEDWQLEFWERAINSITSDFHLSIENLMTIFERKGRKPLAIEGVVPALLAKGSLIELSSISNKAAAKRSKNLPWATWLTNKAKGLIFKSPLDTRFISRKRLNSILKDLRKLSQERNLYSHSEVVRLLEDRFGLQEEEIETVLEYLYTENIIDRNEDIIKFSDSQIDEKDIAVLKIQATIADLQKEINRLTKEKELAHSQVLVHIHNKEKETAKEHLKRRKMIENRINSLNGSLLNLEQQVLSINSSETTQTVFNMLKLANQVQSANTISVEQVSEVLDDNRELIEDQEYVAGVLAENDEDPDLLKELEDLDAEDVVIESPPTHPIIREKEKPETEKIIFN